MARRTPNSHEFSLTLLVNEIQRTKKHKSIAMAVTVTTHNEHKR
jgi:hypothetical protein